VNLAYALEGAASREEVASFPGRLPDVEGRFREVRGPEFGASHHLSSILLSALRSDRRNRAVINLRFSPQVSSALRKLGWEYTTLEKGRGKGKDGPPKVVTGKDQLVVDPGDFGIEPCLYIFGASPLEVVSRTYDLNNALTDMKRGEPIG
jgi:hypothetical protein